MIGVAQRAWSSPSFALSVGWSRQRRAAGLTFQRLKISINVFLWPQKGITSCNRRWLYTANMLFSVYGCKINFVSQFQRIFLYSQLLIFTYFSFVMFLFLAWPIVQAATCGWVSVFYGDFVKHSANYINLVYINKKGICTHSPWTERDFLSVVEKLR